MSTKWHYHCVECNEDSESSWNHLEGQLFEILEAWPLIRPVYELLQNDVWVVEMKVMNGDDALEFLHRHHEHDITIESEYGRVYDPNPPKEEPFPAKLEAVAPVVAEPVVPEIILEIKETTEDGSSYGCKEGFCVKTTKQEVLLLIDSYQSCCESFGYFMVDESDDITRFIGAALLDIRLTDDFLKPVDMEINTSYGGGIMFVDLVTDRGVLQFIAYNEHNGYYGHSAVVKSTQLETEEYL